MKYKKRAIVVDAFQWGAVPSGKDPKWIIDAVMERRMWVVPNFEGGSKPALCIKTEGRPLVARCGDWIVREPRGGIYPVPENLFHEVYEPATAKKE